MYPFWVRVKNRLLCLNMRNRESEEERTLRKILKMRRIELKLSQRDVAKDHNFPHTFISKYETGERFLTFTEVIKICKYFHLDIHEVVDTIASASGSEKNTKVTKSTTAQKSKRHYSLKD